MAQASLSRALRRTVFRLAGGPTTPDEQLLARFVARQDDEAFAQLVRRHGPTVLRVCQAVLRNTQDAEDAFQATFIVLARKAASLAQPELLANWLYRVARRAAQHARARVAKQCARERAGGDPELGIPQCPIELDWRRTLDEELSRLPDKYQAPLVLCYLEGKTSAEAAAALRCPLRTMERRLSEARQLLRSRLTRHGLTLTAAMLASLLAQQGRRRWRFLPG